jgi:hypothetical protein
MAACLTGAILMALALPLLANAQTKEISTENTAPAAQEAAKETDQPDEAGQPAPSESKAENPEPSSSLDAETAEPEKSRPISLILDGKDVTGSLATLNWSDASVAAPTAQIQALGADGQSIAPEFASSDASVVSVDASGFVTAEGFGVATVTAKLDARWAAVQISVNRKVERVVIIAEDTVSPGHSMKLRAFDQDGNRINVLWSSSSDSLARISEDGVLTAARGAEGQTVNVTAFAGENSDVSAVKTIFIG